MEADTDAAPEVLAVHAEEANLTDRAIDLWEKAAKVAIARPAFDEGMAHLRHAIALLTPKVDGGDRDSLERCLAMQTQLGLASMAGNGFGSDQTKSAWIGALALADEVGETPLRFSILYGLMITRYIRGRSHRSSSARTGSSRFGREIDRTQPILLWPTDPLQSV